jgi:hypothetical protein
LLLVARCLLLIVVVRNDIYDMPHHFAYSFLHISKNVVDSLLTRFLVVVNTCNTRCQGDEGLLDTGRV